MTTATEYSSSLAQSPRIDAEVDNVIDTTLAFNRIVGTVLVIAHHGEIVYQRAAGFADREARKLMQTDTVFRLASLTKPIVAAAALALIEQGKLGLDDPVTKWLPEFRPLLPNGVQPSITIRQLLTHTSGLSYSFLEREDGPYHRANVSDALAEPGLTIEENLGRLASVPLVYEPGTSFQYSLAMDVLGEVLARVQGASLPEVTAALVTGPLGMLDTSFTVRNPAKLAAAYADGLLTPVRMKDHHVVPYPPGAGVSFAPGRILDPASYPSGGAGMAGTASDFIKFLETLRTGGAPILRPETVKAMNTNQTGDFVINPEIPGWGFGFGAAILVNPFLAQTPQSTGTYRWGGAYGHSWFVDPQLELTVVALTNTAFEGMVGGFTVSIRDTIYRAIAG